MALLDKRLLIVGGKGGVGKSVVAASLAQIAARQGKKTLLVAVDTLDRFSTLLDCDAIGSHIAPVRGSLFAINLDPKSVAQEFLELHIPIKAIARRVFNSAVFHYWFEATPMLAELMLLGKIWRLVTEMDRRSGFPSWDNIVVEAPATGHCLGLLRASITAGQLLVGPMRGKADEITAMLQDPAMTRLILTTLAEDMPVNEALELDEQARTELAITTGPLIVNAVYPALLDGVDEAWLGQSEAAPTPASPAQWEAARAAARYCIERRKQCERQLRRLDESLAMERLVLPWITAERFGVAQLDHITSCLEQALEAVESV